MQDALQQLLMQGIARIAFPHVTLVDQVMNGFNRFLAESDEYRELWHFDLSHDNEADDGYVPRKGKGHDFKIFFHYRPHLTAHLRHRGVEFGRHVMWLKDCEQLFWIAHERACELLSELDKLVPGRNLERRMEGCPTNVLRLLSYDFHSGTRVMAQPHYDRSFLTLHLAEQRPALIVGGTLEPAKAGEAIIFFGLKGEAVLGPPARALLHNAVDPEGSQSEEQPNRWAIIFFAHLDFVGPLPSTVPNPLSVY